MKGELVNIGVLGTHTGSCNGEQRNSTDSYLGLQGAFLEHTNVLNQLDGVASAPIVKTAAQLRDPNLDGLIIPGGESTTMMIIAEQMGLVDALREFIQSRPVWVRLNCRLFDCI